MKNLILGDGAMGTELRRRGVEVPSHVESIWSALALKEATSIVEEIHIDYIEAGSDYITTNNYAVTRPILSRDNLDNELESLTIKSIEIAKAALSKTKREDVKILGSLPPLETSYRADLILKEEEMNKQYSEIANILKDKVDIIICETMASALEAKCALKAALETNMPVWVSWTLHGDVRNTLPSGETVTQAFTELNGLEPDAYLVNCCAANLVTPSIKALKELTDIPIGGYANAENVALDTENSNLKFAAERHWNSAIEINEKAYLEEARLWIKEGASIIGG
ncbi:MAG: homocysteine S-methyltransferase family protein, partial [SAR86 cluster bacterium]|nr:homocysteine S-methyltransferase family protein [SAR86 cluster bacterium]